MIYALFFVVHYYHILCSCLSSRPVAEGQVRYVKDWFHNGRVGRKLRVVVRLHIKSVVINYLYKATQQIFNAGPVCQLEHVERCLG